MLALIAGEGALPGRLCDALDRKPHIAALEGFPPGSVEADESFRIERLGSFLSGLAGRGVTEVCFAGAIRRPPLDPAMIDAATLPMVPRMMQALHSGDDAALRIVLALFEEAGLAVRAAQDLAPDLMPPQGVLGRHAPNEGARRDAARGAGVVAALGSADVGQAAVICGAQVLATEAVMGTDWMLRSVAAARKADGSEPDLRLGEAFRRGGVLYKAAKPEQDMRIDVPVIGPETIEAAAAAGLDGVAVEAGRVMILDVEAAVDAADRRGLFLWVREP